MLRPDIRARRSLVADAWRLDDQVVVIGAGRPIPLPGGADQCHPFRVHPDHRWLTGRDGPGNVLVFDARDGWTEFVAEVTEAERLWEGREDHDVDRAASGGDAGADARSMADLPAFLEARRARAIAVLGAPTFEFSRGMNLDAPLAKRVGALLLHARRPKDAFEIALMRRAAAATAAGFVRAREVARPGVAEREIAIELEAALFRAGGQRVAYDTIVASGPRSAILHGLPTERVVQPGELVLIDAGAEIDGYCADVTRVFPVGRRFTAEQQALRDIVAAVLARSIPRCRAGTQWRDVHRAAARDLAEGLVHIGLLRGTPDALLEREAIALFFPHGIGHMFGLGVRDAGGTPPGAPDEPSRCCGVTLRVDLPLAVGYAMTVEPGAYLVPALLRSSARREKFGDCVDWPLVDRWLALGVGGVRIEENIVVTSGAPDMLTSAIA